MKEEQKVSGERKQEKLNSCKWKRKERRKKQRKQKGKDKKQQTFLSLHLPEDALNQALALPATMHEGHSVLNFFTRVIR